MDDSTAPRTSARHQAVPAWKPPTPPQASAPATITNQPADSPRDSEGNIKDTIESILIAFILAFIFRAFVVEAFVIPTGSMAPTLMGAHMRFRCEDCGYEWTVNFSSPGDGDDVFIPKRANEYLGNGANKVFALRCPNCGHRVPRYNPVDPDNQATNPPVSYGDRILVLKYLYLFQDPQRWDVVVFKAPAEPQRWDYSQNYIKRLVGRPGETIMILDGDIYVAKLNGRPQDLLTPEDFEIQTKPRAAQEALWRIVYDNDYYPQGMPRIKTSVENRKLSDDLPWQQPWQPNSTETGWNLGTGPLNGRTFRFDNSNGRATIAFGADANPDQQSLTDWLAYDVTVRQGPDRVDTYDDPRVNDYKGDNFVSDVKLAFFYSRTDGTGPLRAELTKLGRTFIAEITPTKAALLERDKDGTETILQASNIENPGDRPVRVEMTNVDYRVTLRLDDRDVLRTTKEQYHPDIRWLLDAFDRNTKLGKPSIAISAAQQKCELSHLSLWRDVYYQNRQPSFQGGGRLEWATPENFPKNLITLSSTDYFVCGDNSPISGDARYWTEPVNLDNEDLHVDAGRVPARFMLGKAFFVYWPAGFRPIDSAPALAPNFGQMRFIH